MAKKPHKGKALEGAEGIWKDRGKKNFPKTDTCVFCQVEYDTRKGHRCKKGTNRIHISNKPENPLTRELDGTERDGKQQPRGDEGYWRNQYR